MTTASVTSYPLQQENVPPFSRGGRRYAVAVAVLAALLFAALNPSQAMFVVAAVLILTLSFPDPRLLLPGLFAVLPFQQSIVPGGTNVAAADMISALLFVLLLFRFASGMKIQLGWAFAPMLLFLGSATFSSALQWEGRDTAVSLARMFCVTVVPMLAYANVDHRRQLTRRCLYAYLLATAVLSVFSVLAFLSGGFGKAMSTLEIHKNAMGTTYGVAIVSALGLLLNERHTRRVRLVLLCSIVGSCVGILLCLSRGAWFATAAGVLLLLCLSRYRRAALYATFPVAIAIVAVWQVLPDDATDYATDISATASTIRSRLEVIEFVMNRFKEEPVFGSGIGLRKVAEPHNMLVLSLGETGIVGTAALLSTFAAGFLTFGYARRVARHMQDGNLVTTIGPAILLVTFGHGMMDVYWRRGVALAGWAMVGIAVATIVAARRQRRQLASTDSFRHAVSGPLRA